MSDCALSCRDLHHHYAHQAVLTGLNLELPRGALCALLGANGAVKSTLLKILAGAMTPQQGQLEHCGRLGFVPQEVQPALPMTAQEMVLLGRAAGISLLRSAGKSDYQAANQALARVEAEHLAERAFASLSGGERQLVLMARALAANADILLLDEPTAAMDWHNQGITLRLLRELAEQGITIIFSTHAPQHALEFASHALLLYPGGEYRFGSPHEVMSESALSRLYRIAVRRIDVDELPESGTAVPIFSQKPSS